MQNDVKLLPCPVPWCKKEELPRLIRANENWGWVRCPTCSCSTRALRLDEAVTSWNTRTPDPLLEKAAEALRTIISGHDELTCASGSEEGCTGEDLRHYMFKQWKQWDTARSVLAEIDAAKAVR